MILLDTSAAITLLRGDRPPESLMREAIGLSSIVVMELELGVAHGGGRRERDRVAALLSEVKLFPFDHEAALASARVLAQLWKAGRPIGDFDAQIAGHAIALKLPLLSCNGKHFGRVADLNHIDWGS